VVLAQMRKQQRACTRPCFNRVPHRPCGRMPDNGRGVAEEKVPAL
jgi:hypothetical protein